MSNSVLLTNSDIENIRPKTDRIIIDWLSFTTTKMDVAVMVHFLGLGDCPFETLSGSHGFQFRQYFSGISIHYNTSTSLCPDNMLPWVWLEMSGEGCRSFESFGTGNFMRIFNYVCADSENNHITRLDVAFDDCTGKLDIDRLCEDTRNQNFVCKMRDCQSRFGTMGNSCTFGSEHHSDTFIRIYDKAAERGYKDMFHWVRLELQLKDDNALHFIQKLLTSNIDTLYFAVLNNYLRFVSDNGDTNKSRWPVSDFWSRFINTTDKSSLWESPGVIYNLSICENYILKQPVGAIKTLIRALGPDNFLSMIYSAPDSKNPKYKELLSKLLFLDNSKEVQDIG